MSFGFVALGVGASVYGANKASSAQKASTAAATKSADYASDLSYQLGQDELAFAKMQYEQNNPLAQRVSLSQANMMDENTRQAQDYYDYQLQTFRPLEQGLVSQAQNFNTDAYREQLAAKAAADAGRAFSVNQGAMERSMASMGVNPNSGKFASTANQNALGLAAQRAGAMNGTRQQAEQLGWAKQLDAAGLGRNLAGASTSAYGVAGQMGNSAVSNSMQPGNQMLGAMNNANGTIMSGANNQTQAMISLANQTSPWASMAGSIGGSLMGAGTYGLMKKYG